MPQIRPAEELLTEYLPNDATIRLAVARIHMANKKPLYKSDLNREINAILTIRDRKVFINWITIQKEYLNKKKKKKVHDYYYGKIVRDIKTHTRNIGSIYGRPQKGARDTNHRIGHPWLAQDRPCWPCQGYSFFLSFLFFPCLHLPINISNCIFSLFILIFILFFVNCLLLFFLLIKESHSLKLYKYYYVMITNTKTCRTTSWPK